MALGVSSLGREQGVRVLASTSHVVGGAAGGLVTGGAVWLAGAPFRTFLPTEIRLLLVGLVVLSAMRRDLLYKTEGHGRQVPQQWLSEFGPVKGFFLYGAVLGSGALTNVPHAVYYTVLLVPALLADVLTTATMASLFGAARALAVVLAALGPRTSSRILYRSAFAASFYPKVSLLLSVAITGLWIQMMTRTV